MIQSGRRLEPRPVAFEPGAIPGEEIPVAQGEQEPACRGVRAVVGVAMSCRMVVAHSRAPSPSE